MHPIPQYIKTSLAALIICGLNLLGFCPGLLAADPTLTETLTRTPTGTSTYTMTPSPSPTETIIASPTETLTMTPSPTISPTPSITPTITSTPSFTPTIESLLIDDFENDVSYQDQPNARDAFWEVPKFATGTPTVYVLSMATIFKGNTGTCLKVAYNKADDDYANFIARTLNSSPGNCTDFTASTLISLNIYANQPFDIKYKFEDANTTSNATGDLYINISEVREWINYTLPFKALDLDPDKNGKNCDLQRVENIIFMVQPAKLGSGEFYIDNFTLGPGISSFARSSIVSPTPMPFGTGGYACPNPFIPSLGQKAVIYLSPEITQARYTIRIINLNGMMVRTLNNQNEWDGRNDDGKLCEGGVYIYQIETSRNNRINGQVVLLR